MLLQKEKVIEAPLKTNSEQNSNTSNNINNYHNLMMDSLLLRSNSDSFSVDRKNIKSLSALNESHRERVLSFNSVNPNTSSQVRKNPKNFLHHMKTIAEKGYMADPLKDTKLSALSNRIREIQTVPERILDAPSLIDDYYLNLIDWSSQNLLAVALGNSVYLWNGNTYETLQLMTSSDNICSVNWIETGNCLAVGLKNGHIELWDSNKLQQIRDMPGHLDRVCSLSWNNFLLSSGSKDTKILNHDVRVRKHLTHLLNGHTQEVCALKWSPDGGLLASGGNDNLLCIWDLNTGTNSHNQNVNNTINTINSGNLNVNRLSSNNANNIYNSLSLNQINGTMFLAGNQHNNFNSLIQNNISQPYEANVLNFSGHIPINVQIQINQQINHQINSNSGNNITISQSANNHFNLNNNGNLNVNTGNNYQNTQILTGNTENSSQTNRNSLWNIINEEDEVGGRIQMTNLPHGDMNLNTHVNSNLTNDSNYNCTTQFTPKFSFNSHEAAVKALAWCPWQKGLLASGAGSKDKTIKFWNIDNGSLVNSIDTGSQVCALLWSKHEKEIISSHGYSKHQISLWRYPSMHKVIELNGHMSRVLYLAMSPDGCSIVSGAGDETLRFWKIHDDRKASSDSIDYRILGNYQLR
jgi:WD40 repeat protein